jgi:hypothetical protein
LLRVIIFSIAFLCGLLLWSSARSSAGSTNTAEVEGAPDSNCDIHKPIYVRPSNERPGVIHPVEF